MIAIQSNGEVANGCCSKPVAATCSPLQHLFGWNEF
jgi:hypothetical protein